MRSNLSLLSLAIVALATACSNAPAPMPIADSAPATHRGVWYWVGSTAAGGHSRVADPARYQIDFADDANMLVQADCNRGRGGYTLTPQAFTTAPIALTKMGCPPDSQDRDFLAQLARGKSLVVDGDWLVVDLADASRMYLARIPEASVRVFACAGGTQFAAAFGRGSALVLVDTGWHVLPQMPAGSGARYGDGTLELASAGAQASLGGTAAVRQDCQSQQ